MTKIVSRVQRPGGTHVPMGSTSYHFNPEKEGGPHVADVTDKAHVATFLAIPHGYCLLEDADKPAVDASSQQPVETLKDNPADWSNKKAMAYAKEVLGINPKDKNQILELADKKGVTGLDESKAPSALIRELVCQIGVEDHDDEGDEDQE